MQRVGRVRPLREEEQPREGPQCLAGAARAQEKWRMGQKWVGVRSQRPQGAAVTISGKIWVPVFSASETEGVVTQEGRDEDKRTRGEGQL